MTLLTDDNNQCQARGVWHYKTKSGGIGLIEDASDRGAYCHLRCRVSTLCANESEFAYLFSLTSSFLFLGHSAKLHERMRADALRRLLACQAIVNVDGARVAPINQQPFEDALVEVRHAVHRTL